MAVHGAIIQEKENQGNCSQLISLQEVIMHKINLAVKGMHI